MKRFFQILILGAFIFFLGTCKKQNDYFEFSIHTKGFKILDSIPLREIRIRSRVVHQMAKNHYHLHFDPNYELQILNYKPSKLVLKLPYLHAPTFFVNLSYKENKIISNFIFPEGWIDAAELEGFFFIKQAIGWIVPIETIYSPFGEKQYVVKIEREKSKFLQVWVIKIYGNKVIITGDITLGDVLLTSRQGEVVDGMPVRVSL